MYRKLLVATGVLALVVPAGAAWAAPSPDIPTDRFTRTGNTGKVDPQITLKAGGSNAKVDVIVEVAGDPVAVVEAREGRRLSSSERASVRTKLDKTQDKVAKTVTGRGGKVETRMQSAYNGLRVRVAVSQLDAIAGSADVVAVHPVQTFSLDNAVSVPYLGVPQVWKNTGYTGKGVKVAVIDTGIDYTHANFSGPGTVKAYETAHASEGKEADPALFGPTAPRVKGGWDFVGDAYDADDPNSVPKPDPNPLDCNGHGSHVAGTIGGNGVTSAGATYPGPYDDSTASKSFNVGPGVAPAVDLYALRVFGCGGTSDVVTEAIDWAVAHDMDVINMSLGSPYGRRDDPVATAATNAVAAGVVVISSAGNEGDSPYLAGSPGTGEGVISVAAVDAIKTFPGAKLSFSTGATLSAVNATGATIPDASYDVVVLKDNPATAENEALGCSPEAFAAAGVRPGGKQLAVATRGNCARVAKAIYGQQAGAAAVLQLNTDAGYPPYEGPITSNPDDGTPYEVTIPFLGVPSTAADVLAAADGGTVSMVAAQVDNPGYTKYGSFSSNGPRSGDSSVSPNLAAPGVSVVSTGSGTGNGAATISGTSMAAPHVAGVAALTVQAHPKWSASEVATALAETADPEKVGDQDTVRGGLGLVDAAGAVAAQVLVGGDYYRTTKGWAREASLSFGFADVQKSYNGIKVLTITNKGKTSVTYKLSAVASEQSLPAKLTIFPKTVTVKAGKTTAVAVHLKVSAGVIGSSLASEFGFNQVSGSIVLKPSGDGVKLAVPYLLVPRAQADVKASPSSFKLAEKTKPGTPWSSSKGSHGKGKPTPTPVPVTSVDVKLTNSKGALPAAADFYTWGISDGKDLPRSAVGGLDVRAVGVQSLDYGADGQLLVFAVNSHKRFSNAAEFEYDVNIDVDRDGAVDWQVIAVDSGLIRDGSADGHMEVFLLEAATGDVYAAGFLATAPTDSSTVLIPVFASDLGISQDTGAFRYSVDTYSVLGYPESDSTSSATYNPYAKAISDGDYLQVARKGSAKTTLTIDADQWAAQKPLGSMVVAFDNKAADEALLIAGK
ncbi:MAG: S8 family serine peptidase [Propionicimonas sp.]|uniref:S8 family peptidase n=1 Tax=Propionicimonas sp. TaxID=1955623 RepID=UPI002B1EE645|nr:S8 family serine peptidase [Propionicimonas sp.]MEA4943376.1 S8 family serine peptidase [Propionicimonas sp.]MEA5119229.1 S8 family serine peptidase [Propionicimonas sp.]